MATSFIDTPDAPIKERAASTKPRGLTQRAYLNAAASLLDYCAHVAVLSIVTPVLVSVLGSSLFGVWQILSRLVSYMSAADGRPTQALKWVIAHNQADEDYSQKRQFVGSALGVWLMFLPVLAVVSAVIVWLAPVITKAPPELHLTIRLTCVLLVINFLLLNLVALPESVLRGMNLGYKRMGLQAGLNAVGGFITVGALYANFGLMGLASAQILLTILTGLLFWLVVKKYVPWFGLVMPRLSEVRSFFNISIWWLAWTLINKLIMASDVLVLGVVASASIVTTYTLTSYAGLTLLSVISMILGAVTPGLGGVIGQKQYEKAAKLRTEMLLVSWLFATAIGSTILMWNRSFVFLWVGPQYYAGFWANLLIVVLIVQFVFIRNNTYVIDLTLQLRKKVIMGTAAAILSIALSSVLIPALGIPGLCLGMLGGRLVLTVTYPLIINSYLGGYRTADLISKLRAGLTMMLFFAGSGYLGQRLLADTWIEWLICVSGTVGTMLCLALVAGIGPDLRRQLLERLNMVHAFRSSP